MSYYYGQYRDVAEAIDAGLKAIAKAVENAAAKQGGHINYNIIVNVAEDTDREQVARTVAEAVQSTDAKMRTNLK